MDAARPRPMLWRVAVVAAMPAVLLLSAGTSGSTTRLGTVSASITTPASTVLQSGQVKYYIVGPPVNGQQEYLFAIAVRTLGSGNRAADIFNLNQGRIQPDGGALVDPAVLRPGWVLVLPADATGPGVQVGVLPTGNAMSEGVSSRSSQRGQGSGDSGDSDAGARTAVLVVVIAVMVVAVGLLRRGTMLSLPHSLRRHIDDANRILAPGAPPRPAYPGVTSRGAAAPSPRATYGQAPPDRLASVQDVGAQARRERRPPPAPAVADPGAGQPTRAASGRPQTVRGASGSKPTARHDGLHAPDQAMEAELVAASGQDRAIARLVGIRLPRTTRAWLWVDSDDVRPSPTYVTLGTNNEGALCVDLAQAPDVLTVTGDALAAQRCAADLAGQLVGAGVPVTIVNGSIGTRIAGAHVVPALPDAEEAGSDSVPLRVVFCSPGEEDAAVVRRLIPRLTPRTVLVIVGGDRTGRWSVELRRQSLRPSFPGEQ